MNHLTRPHVISRLQKLFTIFVIVFGFITILGIALTQQAEAGFNCDGNSWNVGNETDLNSAISCYNAKTTVGNYTINFTDNISLTTKTMTISNSNDNVELIIEGTDFTINGQNLMGIQLGVRPFTIYTHTNVLIKDINIINGATTLADPTGGGIQNNGVLTITNSIFTTNTAGWGGAIYNNGHLIMANTIISGNTAYLNGGGGIFNSGTMVIYSGSLSNNSTPGSSRGGAIRNTGDLTINDSTISDNLAYYGGGLYAEAGSVLSISHSNILNNSAEGGGGGLFNTGITSTITISNSTISGNSARGGGGVNNLGGQLNIQNTTIFSNSAEIYGGGIFSSNLGGTITISNSTISTNSAGSAGGGILNNDSTLILESSTLSENLAKSGGGLASRTGLGTNTIRNSIIANSTNGSDCFDMYDTMIDGGYNIVEDNSCNFTGGEDPKLGPLQDNGGPTFTHALLPGSSAIDSGDTLLTTDQRGFPRPGSLADDIGAFEFFEFSNFVYLPIIQGQ